MTPCSAPLQSHVHLTWCNIPRWQLPDLLEEVNAAALGPSTNSSLAKVALALFTATKAKAIDKLVATTGVSAESLVTIIVVTGVAVLLAAAVWLLWYVKKHRAAIKVGMQATPACT